MSFNKIHTAKQLIESAPEEIEMLLEDIFPKIGLAGFAGSSDTGKSSFLRQLAYAVVKGNSQFMGLKVNATRKAVLYISTEDDSTALSVMLRKSFEKDANLLGKLFVVDDVSPRTLSRDLEKFLKINPCDLVVIDSTSDIIRGDMNNQSVVRTGLEPFAKVAKRHKCLIVFLHHLNKSAKGGGDKNQVNGSQAFEAKMRSVVILGKPDGYDSNKRSLEIVKGNYTSSEMKRKQIILEFDETTLTFTKTGTAPRSSQPDPSTKGPEIIEAVFKYNEEGKSIRDIVALVSKEIEPVTKYRVEKILKTKAG